MMINVYVKTTNRPDEKQHLLFTNRRAAVDFANACILRDDVISCEVDAVALRTFPNVDKAVEALDFWVK